MGSSTLCAQIQQNFINLSNVETVIGGTHDFPLPYRLKMEIDRGLTRLAKTTPAWFLTDGVDSGVSRHIGKSFDIDSPKARSKTVLIGFVAWGVVAGRDLLKGHNITVDYNPMIYQTDFSTKSPTIGSTSLEYTLNYAHSHFLLIDNGTRGSCFSAYLFRKLFEKDIVRHYVSERQSFSRHQPITRQIPMITLTMEGSNHMIKDVIECITFRPPVPVVVINQSGRASDILAFLMEYGGSLNDREEMIGNVIKKVFHMNDQDTHNTIKELAICVNFKNIITIFNHTADSGLDECIFEMLLERMGGSSPTEKLEMALSWHQNHLASKYICSVRKVWSDELLHDRLLDALVDRNISVVRMFIDNGVSVNNFLTSHRLENLYNKSVSRQDTLHLLVKDVRKHFKPFVHRIHIEDVGLIIEKLLGFGFRSNYNRKTFTERHLHPCETPSQVFRKYATNTFAHPYTELLIWAVLTKRHDMAIFFWKRGKQALIKALLAMKLNKSLASEARKDELEPGVEEDFERYAKEFAQIALDFRDKCFREDPDMANQLILHESKNLSDWTCLFMSAQCHHREFIARTECQMLLSDMWMGGMNERKWLGWKVFFALLFFPAIVFYVEYKTERQLERMPQTEEEHQHEMFASSDSSSSDSSSSEDSDDEEPVDMVPISRYFRSKKVKCRKISERSNTNSSRSTAVQHHTSNRTSVVKSSTQTTVRTRTIPEENEQRCESKFEIIDTGAGNRLGEEDEDENDSSTVQSSTSSSPVVNKLVTFIRDPFKRKRKGELKLRKKLYEFFNAPVTKYVMNFIAHIIFLLVYSYTILVRTPGHITPPETYVTIHIFSLGLEMVIDYMKFPMRRKERKLRTYFWDFDKLSELSAILVHLVAFSARLAGAKEFGRLIYCTNIIYWYLRLFSFLLISKRFGPIIYIAGRNMCDLLIISVILFVSICAFGINRQSIKFPNKDFELKSVKQIFLEPYFMLYGEVYAPDIDPECSGNPDDPGCSYGHWTTVITMTLFLFLCNILVLSLLIAMLNSTFVRISGRSDQYWKFQRYNYVIHYESKSRLPPPFVILSSIYHIAKFIYRSYKQAPKPYNKGLKVFLSDREIDELMEWELMCLEEYFCDKEKEKSKQPQEQVTQTYKMLDGVAVTLETVSEQSDATRFQVDCLNERLQQIDQRWQEQFSSVFASLNNNNNNHHEEEEEEEAGAGDIVRQRATIQPSSSSSSVNRLMMPHWQIGLPRTRLATGSRNSSIGLQHQMPFTQSLLVPTDQAAGQMTTAALDDDDDFRSQARILNRVLRKRARKAGYSPPPAWRRNKRNSSVSRTTTTTKRTTTDLCLHNDDGDGDDDEDANNTIMINRSAN